MSRTNLEPALNSDRSMVGLRVLLIRQNTFKPFFVPLLEAARKQWSWHVDVLCEAGDHPDYSDATAGSGKVYELPDMRQRFVWETDEQIIAETDKRIRDAEIAAGVSLNRLPLANQRDIGSAYVAPYWNVKDTSFVRKVLQDNLEPFRVARRFFRAVDDILAETAPGFVLTYEWGKPFRFAAWLAAAGRGIPCIAIRRSKILSDRGFCTTHPLLLNLAAVDKARERQESGGAVSDEAKAYIEEFRLRPAMVKYIENRWQTKGNKRKVIWTAQFAKHIAKDVGRTALGRFGKRRSYALWQLYDHYRPIYLARHQERFFHRFDERSLREMKYIYFPMHKETDISHTFQAAFWHNQRNTIQVLASSLPSGYRLLVREHRFNHSLRPKRYSRELSQLPNVVIVDPFDSQYKYLNNADLIVTENGSSGWEGLLFNRRVITLAPTFYDGAGQAAKVTDANKLAAAIIEALARPAVVDQIAHDRALGCMVDAERETTFPMKADGISEALESLTAMFAHARNNDAAASRLSKTSAG